jgi:sulfatase maturation enzyme AslB (radical SAM superfamily)
MVEVPMSATVKAIRVLPNSLYIEPISSCNLHCRMCYANVVNGEGRMVREAGQVLDFVRRVRATADGQVDVYWCGTGEVFLHRDFPQMVNTLLAEYAEEQLTQTIQTNGMVRRLKEFTDIQRLSFNVSIDGPREFHEWHRGKKTYDTTIGFCREALDRGARSLLVRMLLTRNNIHYLDEFHAELLERIGPKVELAIGVIYTNDVLRPVRRRASAIAQVDIDDNIAISREDALQILADQYQNRYELDEDPEAVSNYLSLTTYGVYSCCHGVLKMGEPEDDVNLLRERIVASESRCRACAMFPCV